ncbi:MAG: peptidoglycan DD-metalloendopeptidase family protein [Clostridia bacterium]
MEKIISQEERIRRAEEIYNRRRYENRNGYSYNTKRQPEDISIDIKAKMAKKMIAQMIICVIIYVAIYLIQHSEQLFSQDFMNKTKEILAYDISVDSLISYWNDAKNNINGFLSQENNNEIEDNVTENLVQEEQNLEETQELESTNLETDENQETTSQEEGTEEQVAVGGAEEEAPIEEKTQEQLDIEYVKQNINIIWPLTGVITSRFGTRTPTEIVTANHYGIDIAGDIGTTIVAATDGVVTQYSTEGDYGYHLRIENGEVTTLYAHCSKLCVEEGQTVTQGQKIAEVGETGRATRTTFTF